MGMKVEGIEREREGRVVDNVRWSGGGDVGILA